MVMRRRDLSKVFNYELECLPPYSFDLTVNKRTDSVSTGIGLHLTKHIIRELRGLELDFITINL